MLYPMYITTEQQEQLKYEVLSKDFSIFLTRYLMKWCEETDDMGTMIMRKNRLINMSRTIQCKRIYVLESDDIGNYESAEFAWHDSHFHLIFRELPTVELIEYLCDLIHYGYFKVDFLNELLAKEGASFKLVKSRGTISVDVYSIEEIEESNKEATHPNIRTLVARMDGAFEQEDYSNVLHASASIFETMAKDIIGIPSIQDQTLGGFFGLYRTDSELPEEILNYILETYNKRNSTPLAGHGSLSVPDIAKKDALILVEMTKAFVRIEYRMQRETV